MLSNLSQTTWWALLLFFTHCTAPNESLPTAVSVSATTPPPDERWLRHLLRPPAWVLPNFPEDTLGLYHLRDSCRYYRDKAHLDLLKDARFTDQVAGILCDARQYKDLYIALHGFSVGAPHASDSTAAIVPLLDKYSHRVEVESQADTIAGKLRYLSGYVEQRKGNFPKANDYYWTALQLLPQERFVGDWVKLLGNISQNYNSLGDYKKSADFSQKILDCLRLYSDKIPPDKVITGRSKAFRFLGWSAYEMRHEISAIAFFNQSLALAPDEVKSDRHVFLSKSYLGLGQIDKAIFHVNTALKLAEQYNQGEYPIDAIHQLARCEMKAKNFDKALQLFQEELPHAIEALGKTHPDCYKIRVYLGQVQQRKGNLDSALNEFQNVLRVFEPSLGEDNSPEWALLPIDQWLVDGLKGKSEVLAQLYQQHGDRQYMVRALESIEMALRTQDALFDVFENDTSKLSFATQWRPQYQMAIEQALMLGDTARAYGFAQAAKAALLREQLALSHAFDAVPADLKQQWHLLQTQLRERDTTQQGAKVGDIDVQLKAVEQKIRAVSPNFTKLQQFSAPMSVPQMQGLLPGQTALLDFFWGDSSIFLFAVSSTRLHTWRIPITPNLTNQIESFRQSVLLPLEGRNGQQFLESAWGTYSALLAAPLAEIGHPARLWIVPDNQLHYLPFGALLTEPAAAGVDGHLPCLLRRSAIGYAFTATQLFDNEEYAQFEVPYTGWGIQYDTLALGQVMAARSPQYPMRGFGFLPKSAIEVQKAQQLMNGTLFLNRAASKASFLGHINRCRIAHLAMHALADSNGAQLPKLVFLTPTGDCDFLTLKEISGLQLNNRMVVLSACNTASGVLMQGEGVSNLGRAFQFAGAKSVLMTQWSAEDNTSAELVPLFLTAVGKGQPNDLALQTAQLAFLDDPAFSAFRAPMFWAGFMVSGDIDPLNAKGNEVPLQVYWLIAALVVLAAARYTWHRRKML